MSDAAIAEVVDIRPPTMTQAIALEIERESKTTGKTLVSLAKERGYSSSSLNNMLSKARKVKKEKKAAKQVQKKSEEIDDDPLGIGQDHKAFVDASLKKEDELAAQQEYASKELKELQEELWELANMSTTPHMASFGLGMAAVKISTRIDVLKFRLADFLRK